MPLDLFYQQGYRVGSRNPLDVRSKHSGTAPVQSPVFIRDEFTDTDGVLLQNHTPDVGGAWEKTAAGQDAQIFSNRARSASSTASTQFYRNAAIPPTPDYEVEALIQTSTSNSTADRFDLQVRLGAAGAITVTDMYAVTWDATIPAWVLLSWIPAGTGFTPLASIPDTRGSQRLMKLRVVGNKLTLFRDNIVIADVTDNAITQVGRVGANFGAHRTNTAWMDNLIARAL